MVNPRYIQLVEEGPFPNQIDPWTEKGQYFHQIHGQMIGLLLQSLRRPLLELGYMAGREASLQILTNFPSLPDVFVIGDDKRSRTSLNYSQAVLSAELELGTLLEKQAPELDRLFIKARDTGELITVLEIVSPNNKIRFDEIERYELRRKMLLAQGVHCVEVDLTRSVKHLIAYPISAEYPYHTVIHLNDGDSRFIGINLQENPKRFGLPLRNEIIPIELDAIYHQAYSEVSSAAQIYNAGHYTEDHLPFPSLIREDERKRLLEQLEIWKSALKEA
jgi:hypothetical protein